jgi:hypothetical protein
VANLGAGLCLAAAFAPAVAAWNIQGAVLATAGAWLIGIAILIRWGEIDGARAGIGAKRLSAGPLGRSLHFNVSLILQLVP